MMFVILQEYTLYWDHCSCQQILSPGPSEYGCPYRNYSPENLQSSLLSMYSQQGLRSADLPEVMANVTTSHFHVACTRVFELTHSSYGVSKGQGVGTVSSGECVTHPNQYTSRSMELYKAKDSDAAMVVEWVCNLYYAQFVEYEIHVTTSDLDLLH